MIQSIDGGRTWFVGGGGVALVIVISQPIIEKIFEGWQSQLGLKETSKGRAVGSAGRCNCASLSSVEVGEMMFAVLSKGASAWENLFAIMLCGRPL